MEVLLDTTVIVDFLRGEVKVADYLKNFTSPTISIVTEAEIYQGARDKNDITNWEKFFVRFNILPMTPEISRMAIELLKKYRLSHGLHILDAFIISTAIIYKLAIVTSNTKHFRYFKGLKLVSWPPQTDT